MITRYLTELNIVKDGDIVEAGDQLYAGSVNPQDILRTKGITGVQEFMIREVQSAYRSNSVHINDKHIESLCVKSQKVKVNNPTTPICLPMNWWIGASLKSLTKGS